MVKVGGISWSRSQVSTRVQTYCQKWEKMNISGKISINIGSKTKDQESSENKEIQEKRKEKESQIKLKNGKYFHSWVPYSHMSPSQVTCSRCKN